MFYSWYVAIQLISLNLFLDNLTFSFPFVLFMIQHSKKDHQHTLEACVFHLISLFLGKIKKEVRISHSSVLDTYVF